MKKRVIYPLAGLFLLLAGAVLACQIPVFRYALERWPSDPYLLMVFNQGPLDEAGAAAHDYLYQRYEDEKRPSNLDVEFVDLSKDVDPEVRQVIDKLKPEAYPVMVLFYPGDQRLARPLWSPPLTMDHAKQLVESPARVKLVERILKGDSAVWVMLESGDPAVDDKLEKELKTWLKDFSENMELPEGVVTREQAERRPLAPHEAINVLDSDIPLHIHFTTVRLSRKDAKEQALLHMLLNIEDDLQDKEFVGQPMVFPVFGQGRFLEPLVGKGITRENLQDYSYYICGACGCEVKAQNPGMDLLASVDWRGALEGSELVIDKALPPLQGAGDLVGAISISTQESAVPENKPAQPALTTPSPNSRPVAGEPPKPSPMKRNLVITLAALVAVVLVVTFVRRPLS